MARMGFAEKLKNLFSLNGNKDKETFFEDLSDILVEGDFGAKPAFEMVDQLEKRCKAEKITDEEQMKKILASLLLEQVKTIDLQPEPNKVNVYMILGVNGVGKTTSVAKLAGWYKNKGVPNVVLAAADTFRAAAIEQLEIHGKRLDIRVVAHQHGSDPSAVVFDASEAVAAKGGGLVLADTAGRLHNKENLVRELQKIDRVAESKASKGCYKKILVLDATTGQNALRQAEVFHEAVGVDAVILTKYDSTAKGGVAFSLGKELGIPVAYVGFGEDYQHIKPFSPEEYVAEFLGN